MRRIAWMAITFLVAGCGGLVSTNAPAPPDASEGVSGAGGAAGAVDGGVPESGGSAGVGGMAGASAAGGMGGTASAGGSAGIGGSAGAGGSGGTPGCPALCNGACCNGTCVSGRCLQTLASGHGSEQGSEDFSDIAVDATNVYWAIEGLGPSCVMKVPLSGGVPVALAPGASAGCVGVSGIDENSVYFVANGELMKVPLGGGSPITLTPNAGNVAADGFAVHAGNVYWVGVSGSEKAILKVPVTGGSPSVVASWPVGVLGGFAAITVGGTSVYWLEYANRPVVMRSPLSGGTAVQLGQADAYSRHLTLGAKALYWGVWGRVEKMPRAGGTVTTLAAGPRTGISPFTGIAVDGSNVYYFSDLQTNGDAALTRVPVGGGTPVTLAKAQNPAEIAIDATSVYWTETMGADTPSHVMKLTPK